MKAAQTRNQIVVSSRSLFIENGLNGVTMTDIVDASGLSRGGVYRYFQSVKEVFEALMETELSINKNREYGSFADYLNEEILELRNIRGTLRFAGYEYMMKYAQTSTLAQRIYDVNIKQIMTYGHCNESEATMIFTQLEGMTVMALSGILNDAVIDTFKNKYR